MSIQGIFPTEKWDFNSESVMADLPLGDWKILTAHQTVQVYKKGEMVFREVAYPGAGCKTIDQNSRLPVISFSFSGCHALVSRLLMNPLVY